MNTCSCTRDDEVCTEPATHEYLPDRQVDLGPRRVNWNEMWTHFVWLLNGEQYGDYGIGKNFL
jgi:hypothetical protein